MKKGKSNKNKNVLTRLNREVNKKANPIFNKKSQQENYDKDNPLKFKKFEDMHPFFADENVRGKMQQIFMDADEVQGEMCAEADAIKKDIFQKLPTSVRYDKDLNKKGLKEGHFQALVRTKAMSLIKDKDKYTKYVSSQVENSNNNIDREEVILGKTEQM